MPFNKPAVCSLTGALAEAPEPTSRVSSRRPLGGAASAPASTAATSSRLTAPMLVPAGAAPYTQCQGHENCWVAFQHPNVCPIRHSTKTYVSDRSRSPDPTNHATQSARSKHQAARDAIMPDDRCGLGVEAVLKHWQTWGVEQNRQGSVRVKVLEEMCPAARGRTCTRRGPPVPAGTLRRGPMRTRV